MERNPKLLRLPNTGRFSTSFLSSDATEDRKDRRQKIERTGVGLSFEAFAASPRPAAIIAAEFNKETSVHLPALLDKQMSLFGNTE
jgi:hypothetical protein